LRCQRWKTYVLLFLTLHRLSSITRSPRKSPSRACAMESSWSLSSSSTSSETTSTSASMSTAVLVRSTSTCLPVSRSQTSRRAMDTSILSVCLYLLNHQTGSSCLLSTPVTLLSASRLSAPPSHLPFSIVVWIKSWKRESN
jgi:hypothetical protein